MGRREEYVNWYYDKAESGAFPNDVRAFNCILRNLGHKHSGDPRPFQAIISEWTDEDIIMIRNCGKKTFEIIKAVRDEAAKWWNELNEKEFIIQYRPEFLLIVLAKTEKGKILNAMYNDQKKQYPSWRTIIQLDTGSYLGHVWAMNAAEAAQNFMDICAEEES